MIAAVGIGGWWWLHRAAPASPLRIGVVEWPSFYHLSLRAADGWTIGGRAVEVTVFRDNPSLNDAWRQGSVDAAAGTLSDVLLIAAHGLKARVVAPLDFSTGADCILGTSTFRFDAATPPRIAFEGVDTFSHLFVLEWLRRHHVPQTAVRMVDMAAAEVPKALADGRVDAGHTWGSLVHERVAAGDRVLWTAGDDPGVICDVLAVRSDRWSDDALRQLFNDVCLAQAEAVRDEPATINRMAKVLGKSTAELMPMTGQVDILDRARIQVMMTGNGPGSLLHLCQRHLVHLRQRGQIPEQFSLDPLIKPVWQP